MRIKSLMPMTLLTVVLLSSTVSAGQDLCAQARKWKTAQPIFSTLDVDNLLVVTRDKTSGKERALKQRAEAGNYYFENNNQDNALTVFSGKDYRLTLSVPDYQHRKLQSKWINPKLLLIEVWFNPHYGAYWIFDVELERPVLAEQQNDGLDAWRQCREKSSR